MQKPIEYDKIKFFHELQIGLIKEGRKLSSTMEKMMIQLIILNTQSAYRITLNGLQYYMDMIFSNGILQINFLQKILFIQDPLKEFTDIIKNTPNPDQQLSLIMAECLNNIIVMVNQIKTNNIHDILPSLKLLVSNIVSLDDVIQIIFINPKITRCNTIKKSI